MNDTEDMDLFVANMGLCRESIIRNARADSFVLLEWTRKPDGWTALIYAKDSP